MDPDQTQTIRGTYYKAIEGLRVLTETLELADLELGSPHDHLLIEEHHLGLPDHRRSQTNQLSWIL